MIVLVIDTAPKWLCALFSRITTRGKSNFRPYITNIGSTSGVKDLLCRLPGRAKLPMGARIRVGGVASWKFERVVIGHTLVFPRWDIAAAEPVNRDANAAAWFSYAPLATSGMKV